MFCALHCVDVPTNHRSTSLKYLFHCICHFILPVGIFTNDILKHTHYGRQFNEIYNRYGGYRMELQLIELRQWLQQLLPNHVVGIGHATEWPPCSPDLIPLYFFLWVYLKNTLTLLSHHPLLNFSKELLQNWYDYNGQGNITMQCWPWLTELATVFAGHQVK